MRVLHQHSGRGSAWYVTDDEARGNQVIASGLSESHARELANVPNLCEVLGAILDWADPYALPNCDRNARAVERAHAVLAILGRAR